MDEIKMLLQNMQQEMKQQKTDMLEMKDDIKNAINNNINEKFRNLEIKNEILEQKIEKQSTAIHHFERHIRRKNLVMFGVEEREKSYHELEKIITDVINTHFNFQCEKNCIEAVRRLGKKCEKTRPVVITFSTMGLKIKIQENKNCLENTPYYIKQDYPIDVLNKRKELQTQLKREKESGNTAFIKYDKLIVLKNNASRNYVKKRNMSESPEITEANSSQRQTAQENKKQPTKKVKTASNMKSFIIQKPKLVYDPENTSHQQQIRTKHNTE